MKEELQQSDINLVVLTADPPKALEMGVRKHKLDRSNLNRVDPAVWQTLDIANPKRPEIPVPTTYVVDPAGNIVWSEQTAVASKRVDGKALVAQVKAMAAENKGKE